MVDDQILEKNAAYDEEDTNVFEGNNDDNPEDVDELLKEAGGGEGDVNGPQELGRHDIQDPD